MGLISSHRWILGSCLLWMAGCGGGNFLDGSIGESFDLDFDLVRVRKQNETLLIEYIKLVSDGENKTLKIVIEGRELVDEGETPIPMQSGLSISDDLFHRAVTVDRIASTGAELPEVAEGRLFFTILELFENGRVEGVFDVVFDNGRTLSGSFMGALQLIDMS